MRPTHTLKDAIQSLFATLEIQQRRDQETPQALIQRVLSKKELEHVRVGYFKKGILCINVDSSVWLYNLNLHKDGLLNKLRAQSQDVIKDIRFSLGDVK
ncbi:MAG: DciA family protein [Candidatus Omnitrophica bacterium]|nr:DciA family protein [Candidatus Omnitrophota bacterium]